MKKLVLVSLFITAIFISALIAAWLVSIETNKGVEGSNSLFPNLGNSVSSLGSNDLVPLSNTSQEPSSLTLATVKLHNSSSDCWIIIRNNVYAVSSYLKAHPGGASTIVPYCGSEASEAFASKDFTNPLDHSAFAYDLLSDYYVGTIGTESSADVKSEESVNANSVPISNINAPVLKPIPSLPSPSIEVTKPVISNLVLDANEISSHGTTGDCWVIFENKVYDVSSYLRSHPGGVGTISPYCGKDMTAAFASQGHSQFARSLLPPYYIGDLGQTIQVSNPQPSSGSTSGGSTPSVSVEESSVEAAIEAQFPGATITKIETEDDGRKQVKIIYNGNQIEVKLNASNQITKVEDDD